jgi:3-hydroxy-9,10-secoandrosta-1,3,5(10)-triene-9,17-dione monooxygenase
MHASIQHIDQHGAELQADGPPGDRQGNLTARTVQVLRASRGFRLLLARDLGGDEAHPVEFIDWVMAVGAWQPAAGWIAGVVGVHPWEISFMHPRLQQEVYGADPDVWTASPYAPFGRARPVEGGFLLTGEWPYSTGTDYSDWVILGGIVTAADGSPVPGPPDIRHFVLPRGDYTIVADSWNVMGLKGTGSKSVRMVDAFVPDYRVSDARKVSDGTYAAERRPGSALYALPFGLMFSAAISAGTLGIAAGLLRAQREYMAGRVSVTGAVAKSDPVYLQALAAADADLDAAVCHLRSMLADLHAQLQAGRPLTLEQRLRFRRNQVRGTDRLFESIAPLMRLAGSAGVQEANDLERWWRDLQTAITHICNLREPTWLPWAQVAFGGQPPPGGFY